MSKNDDWFEKYVVNQPFGENLIELNAVFAGLYIAYLVLLFVWCFL